MEPNFKDCDGAITRRRNPNSLSVSLQDPGGGEFQITLSPELAVAGSFGCHNSRDEMFGGGYESDWMK
jgi:hypothetical protein